MHLFFLFLSNFVVQSSFVNPKIKVKHEESHHGLLTNYSLRYCAKKHILQHADLLANSSLFYQAGTLNIVP